MDMTRESQLHGTVIGMTPESQLHSMTTSPGSGSTSSNGLGHHHGQQQHQQKRRRVSGKSSSSRDSSLPPTALGPIGVVSPTIDMPDRGTRSGALAEDTAKDTEPRYLPNPSGPLPPAALEMAEVTRPPHRAPHKELPLITLETSSDSEEEWRW